MHQRSRELSPPAPRPTATRRKALGSAAVAGMALGFAVHGKGAAESRFKKRQKKRRVKGMVKDLQGMAGPIDELDGMIDRLGDIPGMEEFAAKMVSHLDDIENWRVRALNR